MAHTITDEHFLALIDAGRVFSTLEADIIWQALDNFSSDYSVRYVTSQPDIDMDEARQTARDLQKFFVRGDDEHQAVAAAEQVVGLGDVPTDWARWPDDNPGATGLCCEVTDASSDKRLWAEVQYDEQEGAWGWEIALMPDGVFVVGGYERTRDLAVSVCNDALEDQAFEVLGAGK